MVHAYDDGSDSLIGTTIDGRFTVRRIIGRGGMGIVYEGLQVGLDAPVAIKVLHEHFASEPGALKRFHSEALIASSIAHKNVVTVHAFGLLPAGAPYLVMEYVDGITLSEYLREHGSLEVPEFISVFTQCCDGLAAAHERGFIHRDVKPGNILLVKQRDGRYLVKVTDFGIAKREQLEMNVQGLTRTGQLMGTPQYMSPEQCAGKSLDNRADIYSLGCVMFESLAGHPPFKSDTAFEVMLKHLNEECESPTEKHAHLRKYRPIVDAVMHTLQKSPDARPATMWALRDELVDAGNGISNFHRKRVLQMPKWSWKIAVATIAFGLMAVVVFAATSPHTSEPRTPDEFFAGAQSMENAGDSDRAGVYYQRYLGMIFRTHRNGIWILPDEYNDEQTLRRIFQAAKGTDARLEHAGWPARDHWYQARNAAEAYYRKTHSVPDFVIRAVDDKVRWTEDHAQEFHAHPLELDRQRRFAEDLQNSVNALTKSNGPQ